MVNRDCVIEAYHCDNAAGIRYEAVSDLYPELIGLGDSEEAAYHDLRNQINFTTRADACGTVRFH